MDLCPQLQTLHGAKELRPRDGGPVPSAIGILVSTIPLEASRIDVTLTLRPEEIGIRMENLRAQCYPPSRPLQYVPY
jgi:hypothetical protein